MTLQPMMLPRDVCSSWAESTEALHRQGQSGMGGVIPRAEAQPGF